MAHGVNTAVKEDETAGRHQMIDLIARQARPQQLASRHNPVLRGRDRARKPKWSRFAGYRPVKLLHPANLAPIASPLNAQSQRNGPETPTSLPSRR